MKPMGFGLAALGLLVLVSAADAAWQFSTVSGEPGQAGHVDGPAGAARWVVPNLVVADPAGGVVVADSQTLRRIAADGTVSTIAGVQERATIRDGVGTQARFGEISGLAMDSTGNLYVTEADSAAVRRVTRDGIVSTYCGSVNEAGAVDGLAALARFRAPAGIACDRADNLFVVDAGSGTIRRITPAGEVSTPAGDASGSGTLQPVVDGIGSAARFRWPGAIAVDATGTLYVADDGCVRKVTPTGQVTTLAGASADVRSTRDGRGAEAAFDQIKGLAVAADGTLYVAGGGDDIIRSIAPDGTVTTVAGQFSVWGTADGVGGAARFWGARGLAFDASGNLYVCDAGNATVRRAASSPAVSPPIFLTAPGALSRYVAAGQPCTWLVSIASSVPVAYQWFRDGQEIAGAGEAALVQATIAAADAGRYAVAATNAGGTVVLDVGYLSVFQPPVASFTTRHARPGGSDLWGIAAGQGVLVAVGTGGTILVSADGTTWVPARSGVSEWLVGVTFGGGQFVVVGEHGTIITSPDAVNWTRVPSTGTTERLNNVIHALGLFVVVGEHGTIVTSPDGQTWTLRTSGVTGWLRGVAFNPHQAGPLEWMGMQIPRFPFAVCGEAGTVLVSSDGLTWQSRSAGVTVDLEAIVQDDVGFAAIGADGMLVEAWSFGGGTAAPTLLWWAQPTGAHARFRGLAVGAGALFATGEGGAIVSAPGPRGPWATLSSGTTANLLGGVFVGNSLFVVGRDETILQSSPLHTSRLVNISSRAGAGQDEATLSSGFVISGASPKRVLLRAVGPGLTSRFGMTGTAASPGLTLFDRKGNVLAENRGWTGAPNPADLIATAATVGAFPLRRDDADSALLVILEPGLYSAQVKAERGGEGLCLVEAYDADVLSNDGARTINISTRAEVGAGNSVLIAGFVVTGSAERRVLIRAAGPALRPLGIASPLAEPQLKLFRAGTGLLQTAGAWTAQTNRDEIRDAARRAGAFPFAEDSKDAAIVTTVMPGAYTVHVEGGNGTKGIALVEVYDLP